MFGNFFFLIILYVCLFLQGGWEAQTNSAVGYKNLIVDIARPDSTVSKAADGCFYVYVTEFTRNVPIMKSKDLVEWMYCNTAFPIRLVLGLSLKMEFGHPILKLYGR